MAQTLSPQLLAQLLSQESSDPFLSLVTLSHPSFGGTQYLVNNTKDIISRGITFRAFPLRIRLPADDGETARAFSLDFDNVGLELVDIVRSVTTPISVKIEYILASMPDEVQMVQDELLIQSISINKTRITAAIVLDNFLNVEMTSERYGPSNFSGLF